MLVLAITIVYIGFNFTDLISPNPFSTDSTDPLEFIGIFCMITPDDGWDVSQHM
jgi:hypothetical protein